MQPGPTVQGLGVIALAVTLIVAASAEEGGRGGEQGKERTGGRGPPRRPCPESETEFMPAASTREDGSAWDPETSTLYPNGTHWTQRDPETNTTDLFGCPCRLGRPCIRKCCQMGMAMDSNMACVRRVNGSLGDGGAWFRPVLSDRLGDNVISVEGNAFRLGLLTDKPCVPNSSKELRLLNETQSYIRASDANLCVLEKDKETCVNFTQFCHDFVEDKGSYQSVFCPQKKPKKKGWGVKFLHSDQENFIVNVFKYFTQTVSSIALLFLLVLYGAAAELRSLHGKCHMSHALSLLIYYSLQNLLMYGTEALRVTKGVCHILGPGEIYFYLAPLTWLNVMSIDIMLAFLCLRPIMPGGRYEDIRKFILYSLYAWGVPVIVLVITVIKDFTKEIDEQPTVDDWCEIGTFRQWNYRKYPMYTLLTINGIIFGVTAFKIFSLKRDTSKTMTNDSRRHSRDSEQSNARTKMYFKLLLLMGFHWVLEPLTKVLHTPFRLNERWYLRVIWYTIALVNRLQGVFILIMFMGNAKLTGSVWRKLFKSRFWANITNKIIEVSSSSNKTSSGFELEEASSSSKGANASKRTSTVTLVDMGEFPPGQPKEARSTSIDMGQIPTVSKIVENKARRWSTDTCCTEIDMDLASGAETSIRRRKDSYCVSFKLQEEIASRLAVTEGIEEEDLGEAVSIADECDAEQKDGSGSLSGENGSSPEGSADLSTSPASPVQEKNKANAISTEKKEDKIGPSCLGNDRENLVGP